MAEARATSDDQCPHGLVGGARPRTIRDVRAEPDLTASDRARGFPVTPAPVHESRAHPDSRTHGLYRSVIATPLPVTYTRFKASIDR